MGRLVSSCFWRVELGGRLQFAYTASIVCLSRSEGSKTMKGVVFLGNRKLELQNFPDGYGAAPIQGRFEASMRPAAA